MMNEIPGDIMDKQLMKATFAGGCFWCMQPPFRMTDGVTDSVAGYAGGTKPDPTYEEVSTGTTGYLEAVQVTYDPEKVSYEKLVEVFWEQIDPTDSEGQFADQGSQYHTAIFYHDEEQKRIAEASKKKLDESKKFKKPVMTAILPYTTFYPAEEYHQDYDMKKPRDYKIYKSLSGREGFIEKVWGKEKKVFVYSTPRCHNCHEIKQFLTDNGVDFTEIDIAADQATAQMVIEKTGYIGAPVVQIGDEFIIGWDRKKMESLIKTFKAE
jgi:methionine-S-sulfoxide reductase